MTVFAGCWRAAVAAGVFGVVAGMVGSAADAAPTASSGAPRGAIAGYYGTASRVAQLQATLIVPRVTCRYGEGITEINVVLGNKRQAAFGSVEIACEGQGRANYGVSVFAGSDGAVIVPEEKVRPGNRVVITLAERSHRMTAGATIAGRRPIRMSAKARSSTFFDIGAAVEGRSHAIVGRLIRVRDATLNAGTLGSAAMLVRTSETRDNKTLLRATRLRRGEAFTIRQP